MDVVIRLLDIEKDMPTIEEAWSWKKSAPRWFRETLEIYKESWEEYIGQFPNELHYGVFIDAEPTAIIRLIEVKPFVMNIHLEAKRRTDFEVLLNAGRSVRDYLFERDVKLFYGWLPNLNRGVAKLYEELGFTDSGESHVNGVIRGKEVVWHQYLLANPKMLLNMAD